MTASRFPAFWSQAHVSNLRHLARKAGACILAHRADSMAQATFKPDGSPVTAADSKSEHIIIDGLQSLTPDIPIVAEEKDNPANLTSTGTYWLIDPLDGTRDYVAGGNEFTINMGLLVNNEPCIGLIYAPAQDVMYYGDPNGVECNKKCCQTCLDSPPLSTNAPRVLASFYEAKRLALAAWQKEGHINSYRLCSSALKFGLLAHGEADLYPRLGNTCEWDTAAGDAILRALGGGIVTLDGTPLIYGKPDFRNGNFVAHSPSCSAETLSDFLKLLETQLRETAI